MNEEEKINQTSNESLNNKEKKSKKPIILIVILVLLIALGVFVFIKRDVLFNKNTNTQNNNQQSENNSNQEENNQQKENNNQEKKKNEINKSGRTSDSRIDNATKNRLLNILGIPNDLHYLTAKELKESGLDPNEKYMVDLSEYNYKSYIHYLFNNYKKDGAPLNGEIVTNEMNVDDKKRLIEWYARDNKMMKTGVYPESGEATDRDCTAGRGYCDGITKDSYNKIAKQYGFSNSIDDIFKEEDKYNGYYLFHAEGGTLFNPTKVNLDIIYNYDKEDILVDYIIITKSDSMPYENVSKNIIFRFKKYDDGSYYLYSFTIKDYK